MVLYLAPTFSATLPRTSAGVSNRHSVVNGRPRVRMSHLDHARVPPSSPIAGLAPRPRSGAHPKHCKSLAQGQLLPPRSNVVRENRLCACFLASFARSCSDVSEGVAGRQGTRGAYSRVCEGRTCSAPYPSGAGGRWMVQRRVPSRRVGGSWREWRCACT
ncbi:hypothetical protein FKP32DRAFT_835968 [Trametes sanguinea]|nr:hypothetical protein FKP32DRAFT_835968 [Trametes sanguinea]